MKITREYEFYRRDFVFDIKCEGCGHIETNKSGYDDDYFRNTVIPKSKCERCGKSSNDLGTTTVQETKYNPNITM